MREIFSPQSSQRNTEMGRIKGMDVENGADERFEPRKTRNGADGGFSPQRTQRDTEAGLQRRIAASLPTLRVSLTVASCGVGRSIVLGA